MGKLCPVSDDNDVKCTNIMSPEEEHDDGMCSRCAELMWEWCESDMTSPFVFDSNGENIHVC